MYPVDATMIFSTTPSSSSSLGAYIMIYSFGRVAVPLSGCRSAQPRSITMEESVSYSLNANGVKRTEFTVLRRQTGVHGIILPRMYVRDFSCGFIGDFVRRRYGVVDNEAFVDALVRGSHHLH